MAASKPSASANSTTNLSLGNVPQVEDYSLYEALINIHAAIEALAIKLYDLEGGELGDISAITAYVSARLSVITTAVDYLIEAGDGNILVNASLVDVSVFLPTAVDASGQEHTIKQIAGSYSTLINTVAAQEIDGDSSVFPISLHESLTLKSDGANWWIL